MQTLTETLPAHWYGDRAIFELEQERIFRRSWQLAGSAAQVAEPGDYFTFRAGGVPMVITRDDAGELHALANVCRHRGSEIVEGAGNVESLRCRYHGWSYRMDGCLRAAPRAREDPTFAREDHFLPRLQVATWNSFVFVNPDPDAPPLEDSIGELTAILADSSISFGSVGAPIRREWEIAANWKLLVENYLECYHCPLVHPSFSEVIDMEEFDYREYDRFSIQGGPVRGESGATGSDLFTAYIWPTTFLNTYPGPANMANQVIVPLAPDRSLLIYDYYFLEDVPEAEQREFLAFWDHVQQEDVPLCESVQRGLASATLPQGRLMLPREGLLGHFQRLERAALGDAVGA